MKSLTDGRAREESTMRLEPGPSSSTKPVDQRERGNNWSEEQRRQTCLRQQGSGMRQKRLGMPLCGNMRKVNGDSICESYERALGILIMTSRKNWDCYLCRRDWTDTTDRCVVAQQQPQQQPQPQQPQPLHHPRQPFNHHRRSHRFDRHGGRLQCTPINDHRRSIPLCTHRHPKPNRYPPPSGLPDRCYCKLRQGYEHKTERQILPVTTR